MRTKVFVPYLVIVTVLLVFPIAFLALLAGCVSLPPVYDYKSRHGIEFRGPFTNSKAEKLDSLLDVFPEKVIKSVKSISINDDDNHYSDKDVLGHCYDDGRICIRGKGVNDRYIIWHEVSHAYAFALDSSGSDFKNEWLEVAGDVYGNKTKDFNFPSHGLLNRYSSKNYWEDTAEWAREFYYAVGGYDTVFNLNSNQFKFDSRYRSKLELLKKYGFITEKDYRKFLALDYF